MCGILYMTNFDGSPVNHPLIERFKAQRTRGLEGFGVYDRQDNNLVKSTTEKGILKWLKKYDSSDLLFHHRLPTSAPNVKTAAHPFSSGDQFDTNYILIHNGWINNSDTYANVHLDDGLSYTSLQANGEYNDSETLMWEMALYLEGKIAAPRINGAIAFIMIARGPRGDKLYFYRNSASPMQASFRPEGITLASEGDGEQVPTDTLFIYDYNSRQLNFKHLVIDTFDPTPHYSQDNYYPKGKWNDDQEAWEEEEDKQISLLSWGWPISLDLVKENWSNDHNICLAKGVKKLYNRALREAKGNFEEMFTRLDRASKIYDNALKSKALKKPKTIKKYQSKLRIANATIDFMISNPSWNDPEAQDPSFKEANASFSNRV